VERRPVSLKVLVSPTEKPMHDLPLADELADVSARMSGLLLSDETVESSLGLISSLAHETVTGSSGAGVTVLDERRRKSSGSTDERVRRADSLQYELDQGPCLTAAVERRLVRVDDLAEDRRWPEWADAAAPLGLRASMSAPLVAGDQSLGAIKVYADQPNAFDDHSEQLLGLFAAQAAVLVAHLRGSERAKQMSDGLRQAIHSRDVISIAKGVLMGRHGIDEDAAFGMLLARCEQDGSTIAEIATGIVDSAVRRRR
jgi:GAF domain-containing protein